MNTTRINVLSMVFAIFLLHLAATAQTLELTYQGSLKDGATDANGNYDFQFALFDVGGSQIGSTITRSNVLVTNGVFSVQVNFGNNYTGANRELEIRVRPAGGGAFTTLTPRQVLTATPYSIVSGIAVSALNATNANMATTAVSATNFTGNLAGDISGTQTATVIGVVGGQTAANVGGATQTVAAATSATTPNTLVKRDSNGDFSARIVRATQHFAIGGMRVLSSDLSDGNTFTGINAAANNNGIRNSFFGTAAGINNTEGGRNSFFGSFAGASNTSGSDNSFFGYDTGGDNSQVFGDHNSFFGSEAGRENGAGHHNVFFGSFAGALNQSGSFNVFLGASSGGTTISNLGDNNTLIGSHTGLNFSTLTNATAIGHRAFVGQSNSLVLGSINGVNGATSNTLVGIGTTAPEKELHIRGPGAQEIMIESSDAGGVKWSLQSSGGASGGRFEIVDRTAVANRFTILSNGNIGIGTTTPDDKLEVTGSIRVSILGVGGQTPLCRNGSNQISLCAPSAGYKSDFSQFSSGLELISRQIEEQKRRFEAQQKTIDEQQEMIKSLRTVLCQIKAELEVCKEK